MSYENQRRPRQAEAAGSVDGDNTSVALATADTSDVLANSETSRVTWEFGEAGSVMTVETSAQRWRFTFVDGGDA